MFRRTSVQNTVLQHVILAEGKGKSVLYSIKWNANYLYAKTSIYFLNHTFNVSKLI